MIEQGKRAPIRSFVCRSSLQTRQPDGAVTRICAGNLPFQAVGSMSSCAPGGSPWAPQQPNSQPQRRARKREWHHSVRRSDRQHFLTRAALEPWSQQQRSSLECTHLEEAVQLEALEVEQKNPGGRLYPFHLLERTAASAQQAQRETVLLRFVAADEYIAVKRSTAASAAPTSGAALPFPRDPLKAQSSQMSFS